MCTTVVCTFVICLTLLARPAMLPPHLTWFEAPVDSTSANTAAGPMMAVCRSREQRQRRSLRMRCHVRQAAGPVYSQDGGGRDPSRQWGAEVTRSGGGGSSQVNDVRGNQVSEWGGVVTRPLRGGGGGSNQVSVFAPAMKQQHEFMKGRLQGKALHGLFSEHVLAGITTEGSRTDQLTNRPT